MEPQSRVELRYHRANTFPTLASAIGDRYGKQRACTRAVMRRAAVRVEAPWLWGKWGLLRLWTDTCSEGVFNTFYVSFSPFLSTAKSPYSREQQERIERVEKLG